MRFAHLRSPEDPRPRLAVLDGDAAVFVADLVDRAPATLQGLIESGEQGLAAVRAGFAKGAAPRHPLDAFSYESAVLAPPAILAVGLNYAAHSSELGLKTDTAPTVFTLWPNSLTAHEATTTWPRTLSESVDYEAELGVVMGAPA